MNNKPEKQFSQNKANNYNQYKKDISSYIKSIQNIIDKKSSTLSPKATNKEINQILKDINNLFDKIINDKENINIKIYESLLKKNENTIRKLYGDFLHERLLKEILEEKVVLLLQTQSEYELVKEKTGVIVCDGKVICNERKDNEIIILRTENSTLKNVINDKENEINMLNEKIKVLNNEIIKLKKMKTNINININDINNPPSLSKKNSKFIAINRIKEKELLFNTIYSPGYFSQKEITINNFSSSTKNFYKTYHMNTKIINNNININNKSIDKTLDKSNKNININSHDNTITMPEKLISVNKNTYKKKNSRNNIISSNNYSSCENILNSNINKFKTKSNINKNNNSKIKSKEKKISRKKLFSPLQEYNSVKYINTHSIINSYKEPNVSIPKSTRDKNICNNNLNKNNINIKGLISAKFLNSNTMKKNEKKRKKIKEQKTGYLKRRKVPIFRNEYISKDNFNTLFQRTDNENFKGDYFKIK